MQSLCALILSAAHRLNGGNKALRSTPFAHEMPPRRREGRCIVRSSPSRVQRVCSYARTDRNCTLFISFHACTPQCALHALTAYPRAQTVLNDRLCSLCASCTLTAAICLGARDPAARLATVWVCAECDTRRDRPSPSVSTLLLYSHSQVSSQGRSGKSMYDSRRPVCTLFDEKVEVLNVRIASCDRES